MSFLIRTACGVATASLAFAIALWVLDHGTGPTSVLQSVTSKNSSTGSITERIPPDRAIAGTSEGRLFLSIPFIPKESTSTLRISVTSYASAASNIAVITVFRDQVEKPLWLASKPLSGNSVEEIKFHIDVPAKSTAPTVFNFRIGPGRQGSIYFNGSEGFEWPSPVETTVTISELS